MSYADLVDLDERTAIETVPFNQIEFNIQETDEGDTLHAKIGDIAVPVAKNDRQFEVLCNAFEISGKWLRDIPQELLQNIFVTRAEGKADLTYNWALDGFDPEIIAYGDTKKPYIPYSSIGQILQNEGLSDLDGSLGRSGLAEISGTHEHKAFIEPRVGDITRSGILFRGNILNDTPPEVLPYSFRLECLNGMTSRRERERILVASHDVDDVLEQIEFQARRAFDFAERMNHRFADMVAHQVNPVEAMRNIIVSHRVPTRLHENLLDEARALPQERHTMYDVLNIFTRFATGHFDANRRVDLQSIGGDIAISDHLNCRECGSQLD